MWYFRPLIFFFFFFPFFFFLGDGIDRRHRRWGRRPPIATSNKKTYYHDHVTASSPRTTSFFDPLQPQVLLLVTLRLHWKVLDFIKVLYAVTEEIIKFLTRILILITLSICMKVNTFRSHKKFNIQLFKDF